MNETVNSLPCRSEPARHVKINVCGRDVIMELDTGSAHTVISERIWRTLGSKQQLSKAPQLTAYGGYQLQVLELANVFAKFRGEEKISNDISEVRFRATR